MNKKAIVISTIVLVIVLLCIGIGFTLKNNKNFKAGEYTEKTIIEENEVTSLAIDYSSQDIEFYESDDDKLRIEYFEDARCEYNYSYNDGVAKFIQIGDSWSWFNFPFLPNYVKPITKVYVPKSLNENIDIKVSSSDIDITEVSLNLKTMEIKTSSGDVMIEDVIASEDITINVTSGDVMLTNSECNTADIKVTSGDIMIKDSKFSELLKLKTTSGAVDSARIEANKIIREGSSGDTELRLVGAAEDYKVDAKATSGDIRISGQGVDVKSDDSVLWGEGSKLITLKASSGNIKVIFED